MKIKLLILDVDGVLTDGKLYYSNAGVETKAFYIRDGLGLKLLLKNKMEVAIISSRKSKATQNRMDDLGIKHVYLGAADKIKPFTQLKKNLRLKNENIAYIGDDLPDIPVMQKVGFSIAVADAAPEVLELADHILKNKGGEGAVREACELLIK